MIPTFLNNSLDQISFKVNQKENTINSLNSSNLLFDEDNNNNYYKSLQMGPPIRESVKSEYSKKSLYENENIIGPNDFKINLHDKSKLLEEKIIKLEAEISRLNLICEKRMKEITQLQLSKNSFDQIKNNLEFEINSLKKENTNSNDLIQEIFELKDENKELKNDINILLFDKATNQNEYNKIVYQKGNIEKNYNEIQLKFEDSLELIENLKKKVENNKELEKNVNIMLNENKKLIDLANLKSEESEKLKKDYVKLQKTNENHIFKLKEEWEKSTNNLFEIEKSNFENQNNFYKEKLKEIEKKHAFLKSQNMDLSAKNKELSLISDDYYRKLQITIDENEKLIQEFEKLQLKNEEIEELSKNKLKNLNSSHITKNTEIEELKHNLNEKNNLIRELNIKSANFEKSENSLIKIKEKFVLICGENERLHRIVKNQEDHINNIKKNNVYEKNLNKDDEKSQIINQLLKENRNLAITNQKHRQELLISKNLKSFEVYERENINPKYYKNY